MRRDPAIILLAIGQTLAWATIYYIFPALLLRWEQDLGWSKADLTAAIMMAVLVSAMFAPISGRIIDRGFGPILLATSAMLGGIGLILLSFVQLQWQFLMVWVMMGIAMSGCLYEPCFALLTRSRGANAKQAIILITLAAGFASTISYPTIYTLAEAMGWRGAVRVFAAIVIFVVAPLLWLGASKLQIAQVIEPPKTVTLETSKAFLRKPAFWLLALGFASISMTHSATLQHLLPILDERGLSAEMAVFAASFIGPMQVAGRLAMMASERYISTHAVGVAAFAILALSIIMLLLSAVSQVFLAGFVIMFGSAIGTVSILRPLLTREILGDANFGAKSGALAVPYLTASALAPFLGALVWNWGGYDLLLSLLLGLLLAGSVLYWFAQSLSRSR